MTSSLLRLSSIKICRHLSEKALKGEFLGPDKLRTHTNEGKGKDKRKKERGGRKEEKRKSNGCTPSFYNGYFGEKKLLDTNDGLETHTQVTDRFERKSGNGTYRPCCTNV